MKTARTLLLAHGIAISALLAACAAPMAPKQSSRGPTLPDPGPDKQYQVEFPDPGHGAARYIGLTLGEDLVKECGLSQTHFEFDSAEPLPQDRLALRSLAECLEKPQYVALQLSLVGRADSRGNPGYNAALGLRRAQRAKQLLVEAGVAPGRIRTSSVGARGAVVDEKVYSYGYDRRVDGVVLGVVHAPSR